MLQWTSVKFTSADTASPDRIIQDSLAFTFRTIDQRAICSSVNVISTQGVAKKGLTTVTLEQGYQSAPLFQNAKEGP